VEGHVSWLANRDHHGGLCDEKIWARSSITGNMRIGALGFALAAFIATALPGALGAFSSSGW
jgi:hypothetical protein